MLIKSPVKFSDPATPVTNDMPLGASLQACFLCMLFGGNATAIKCSLAGLGSFTTAGLRFSIAAVTLLCWAVLTGKPLALNPRQLKQIILLSLIFLVQLSCFYLGLRYTTASHGTLISNLLPFIVLILAHFFIPGDRITLKKLVGIGFGFAGVACLVMDRSTLSPGLCTGDFFVLGAVLVWGCNAVYVKHINQNFHSVQITVFPMLFTIPFFFLCGALWDDPMVSAMDAPVVTALLYQAFVTASFGFVAWNTMLQKFGTGAMHSFVFIMPVAGVLSGVVLLNEPVSMALIFAIVFIVTGIVVVHAHYPRIFSRSARYCSYRIR